MIRRGRDTDAPRGINPGSASTWVLTIFAVLILTSTAALAEREIAALEVFRQGDRLFLDLVGKEMLDERTALTVESGLPGTCFFFIQLRDRLRNVVHERFVEHTLRFDLWEDHYVVDRSGEPAAFPTLARADSAWSSLSALPLVPVARIEPDLEYEVWVTIDVRPLAPEDRERLGRYVSRNSGGAKEELVLDLGAVVSRLFGREGQTDVTLTRATEPFRLDQLETRP